MKVVDTLVEVAGMAEGLDMAGASSIAGEGRMYEWVGILAVDNLSILDEHLFVAVPHQAVLVSPGRAPR